MQKFLIIVKFASIGHFCQFYRELSSGSVFLPSGNPLPENARILMQIWIPGVPASFLFPGKVVPAADLHKDHSGMTVDVRMSLPFLLPGLNQALAEVDDYLELLDLSFKLPEPAGTSAMKTEEVEIVGADAVAAESPPEKLDIPSSQNHIPVDFALQPDNPDDDLMYLESDLAVYPNSESKPQILFEEIKQMVSQVEFDRPDEKPFLAPRKKSSGKKELTSEERELAEAVGKFFMNLTKAMLRSGYYDPGHPGAQSAKEGLYDEFIAVSKGCREVMVTYQATRDSEDIMLTGFLDEPVSIRQLVGPGIAELFVPKLCGYCENKKLLGFAVKREITPQHFYDFINIMSDPSVDAHGGEQAGPVLTNKLIFKGITEISAIFVSDRVALEGILPWRVEMAIHRLAKDLKTMPLFKGVSSDALKKLKLQSIQDIIRPLRDPRHLNDFLVNCYLIAQYVDTMKLEDIEEIVVMAFSPDILMPATHITFESFSALDRLAIEAPGNEAIRRRREGIQRVLKLIARRVVTENIPDSQHFLEQLHMHHMVDVNDLPADVKYYINSVRMADDVHGNFDHYMNVLNCLANPSDAIVYLQCFRRAVPVLIKSSRWDTVVRIADTVRNVCVRPVFNSGGVQSGLKIMKKDGVEDFSASALFQSLESGDRPLAFIFKDVEDHIVKAYLEGDRDQRRLILRLMDDLGAFGVIMMGRVLTESTDREDRKTMYALMVTKGLWARDWAVSVLNDVKPAWFTHRNALMLLGSVSRQKEDFEIVRKFLDHSNSKIREEALNAIVHLCPDDGDSLIISALGDEDAKVRWIAGRNLSQVASISETAMNQLLHRMTLPLPNEKELLDLHIKKVIAILGAVNTLPSVPSSRKVESEVLMFLQSIVTGKKTFWKKVASVVGNDHENAVLKAAIPLLGKIGGDESRIFLKQTAKFHPDLYEIIKKAMTLA